MGNEISTDIKKARRPNWNDHQMMDGIGYQGEVFNKSKYSLYLCVCGCVWVGGEGGCCLDWYSGEVIL